MKNFTLSFAMIALCFLLCSFNNSVKTYLTEKKEPLDRKTKSTLPKNNFDFSLDEKTLEVFFKNYSSFKKYQPEIISIYKNRKYNSIWYENDRINELGQILYNKINRLNDDGIKDKLPYKSKIDGIFTEYSKERPSKTDTELLLTSMYVFYASKKYEGIDQEKVNEIGWFLPKKNISYEKILDSLLVEPKLVNQSKSILFSQYYKLKKALKKYRELEKQENFANINRDSVYKEIRPDDSSATIAQIRHRLFFLGDLKQDSKNYKYDQEMMEGVMNFKKRYGLKLNYVITPEHIALLNQTISENIKTIIVNMERCRWISPELEKAPKYVMINIPSYHLIYVKDGKYDFTSNVFVGSLLTETVIFSGNIDRIVFSPYWYIPTSIINNELKSQIASDKNYLAEHNMEWNGGRVRQKPGPNNSLGLVKFMFPNPNDIYLHDTPSKSLFMFEKKTFSHGCINLENAKGLALALLKDNQDWPPSRIDEAMSGVKETTCTLKEKIPIHIGYFTAWVQDNGEINFFADIYQRDERLYNMLYPSESLAEN